MKKTDIPVDFHQCSLDVLLVAGKMCVTSLFCQDKSITDEERKLMMDISKALYDADGLLMKLIKLRENKPSIVIDGTIKKGD